MLKTKAAEIEVVEPGVAVIAFLEGVSIEAPEVNEIIAAMDTLFGPDDVHGNVIDARRMMFLSQEARDIAAKNQRSCVSGVALVVESPLQKTFANLYLTVSRPKIPTRVFNTLEPAKEWIRGQNSARGFR